MSINQIERECEVCGENFTAESEQRMRGWLTQIDTEEESSLVCWGRCKERLLELDQTGGEA